MKTIREGLAELRAMNGPELIERYVAMFGKSPRCRQPSWLFQRCAWRLQEQRLGGLSEAAKRRLEELIAEIDIDLEATRMQLKPARRAATTLGTVVSRVWKGRVVTTTSVEGGWECEGAVHRSLSAVAKAITGSHWNGNAFFNVTKRKAGR